MTNQPSKTANLGTLKFSKFPKKLSRLMMLASYFSSRAAKKPQYIVLCFWAFKELWQVDKNLKELALIALRNNPKVKQPELNDAKLKAEIRRRAIAIYWTARIHPLKTKCLHRSLVLHQWLQSRNLKPTLEIGWGSETGIGHAWITYNGMVLNDNSDVAEKNAKLTQVGLRNSDF